MVGIIAPVAAGLLAVSFLLSDTAPRRDLTFDQRVEAQRVIERVYHSPQIGAAPPFDEAVPRELLERKARTYLKQSKALERFWSTPVTAEALRRELERIAANTLFPERLEEIYHALGDDAFVPDAGEVIYYLVTGVDAGMEGPLGNDSSGNTRPNQNPCPS